MCVKVTDASFLIGFVRMGQPRERPWSEYYEEQQYQLDQLGLGEFDGRGMGGGWGRRARGRTWRNVGTFSQTYARSLF